MHLPKRLEPVPTDGDFSDRGPRLVRIKTGSDRLKRPDTDYIYDRVTVYTRLYTTYLEPGTFRPFVRHPDSCTTNPDEAAVPGSHSASPFSVEKGASPSGAEKLNFSRCVAVRAVIFISRLRSASCFACANSARLLICSDSLIIFAQEHESENFVERCKRLTVANNIHLFYYRQPY